MIDTVISELDTALSTLRTQASKFGSNLTTVQTRQDFTKNLVNTLRTGADNLVLADTNEEGANLLALQTRQQLSTTALSLVGAGRPGGAAPVRLILRTIGFDETAGPRPRRFALWGRTTARRMAARFPVLVSVKSGLFTGH